MYQPAHTGHGGYIDRHGTGRCSAYRHGENRRRPAVIDASRQRLDPYISLETKYQAALRDIYVVQTTQVPNSGQHAGDARPTDVVRKVSFIFHPTDDLVFMLTQLNNAERLIQMTVFAAVRPSNARCCLLPLRRMEMG